MAEFKLPDPKKTSGKVLGLLVLAGLGLLTYAFILPFLLTVVWGTIQLAIGALVLAVLGYILTNPRFWKRLRIILDTFGEMLFKGFVEMNPFNILELQLKKAEEDREQLKVQGEKLKGQQNKLETSLIEEEKARALAAEKMNLLKVRSEQNPQDFEIPLQLESATNDWTNSNDYIEKVSPICLDITKLTEIVDKAYRKSGYALKDARNTVIKQRATYDAVTTGSNAMKKALLAFSGDPEMNRAGAIALEALKKDISNKVGIIKNSIQLTNQLMNERDLNDAAKVSMAVKKAQELDVDGGFRIPEPSVIPETIKLQAK
jgi:hypothetical protein